jgi:hypothetical protein
MESKDTVMTKDGIIILSYMNPEMIEGILQNILEKQAEVSFKAGIKEVVEWIKHQNPSYPFSFSLEIKEHQWYSKLKEWGIE